MSGGRWSYSLCVSLTYLTYTAMQIDDQPPGVVRMVAFILRAVLSGSATAGTKLGLFVAQQVVYSIGFFGLLYSAYTLVLDRFAIQTLLSWSGDR